MMDKLNIFSILIIPELVQRTAIGVFSTHKRAQVEADVIEHISVASDGYKKRLFSSALSLFESGKSETPISPFVKFLAQTDEDTALDATIYQTLQRYPVLLTIHEKTRSGNLVPKEITAALEPLLRNPSGAKDCVAKGLSTLRTFGLVTRSRGALANIPKTPTLEGFGFILHSEYPAKGSLTAPLERILDNPYLAALGCSDAQILILLEEGSAKRYWGVERDGVFQRVVFPYTLGSFVDLVVKA